MRKYILPILCFLVITAAVLLLILPQNGENEKETAPTGVHYTAWNAAYCRIDGTGDSFALLRSQCINADSAENAGVLPAFRIDTDKELQAFIALLNESQTVSLQMQDGGRSFIEVTTEYDAAFFENNNLLLLYARESSGSNRHLVSNVSIQADTVTVVVDTLLPGAGDCDMAGWLIVMPFTKAQLPREATVIARRYGADTPAHTHAPAKTPQLIDEPYDGGYCGNTQTTVTPINGKAVSFEFGHSVTITAMLNDLRYEQPLCACNAEYVVDTEFGLGYEVNLAKAFVRYKGGQVDLTDKQVEELHTAIEQGMKSEFSW